MIALQCLVRQTIWAEVGGSKLKVWGGAVTDREMHNKCGRGVNRGQKLLARCGQRTKIFCPRHLYFQRCSGARRHARFRPNGSLLIAEVCTDRTIGNEKQPPLIIASNNWSTLRYWGYLTDISEARILTRFQVRYFLWLTEFEAHPCLWQIFFTGDAKAEFFMQLIKILAVVCNRLKCFKVVLWFLHHHRVTSIARANQCSQD